MKDIWANALAILVLDKSRTTTHSRQAICDYCVRRYWGD